MQHSFEKRAANHHENAFYLQKRARGERVPGLGTNKLDIEKVSVFFLAQVSYGVLGFVL